MHEPEGYDCPFCRIASGEKSERVVYRNERVMTLVNIKWWPNNPGGVLVVPVEHFENVYELPARLGTPIQAAIREVAIAMKAAFGCDGVSTRQHNEPAGNQDVWHHHTHVFPRYAGDDLYRTHGTIVDYAEVVRVADLIRAHLPTPDLNAMLPARPGAAACVLTDQSGRILIVKPTYRDTWGMPGGGLDDDESPREGCAREILEELGLVLEPEELLAFEHRVNDAGVETSRFLFAGPVLTPDQIDAIVLPPEHVDGTFHRRRRRPPVRHARGMGEGGRGFPLRIDSEGSALYLENGEIR